MFLFPALLFFTPASAPTSAVDGIVDRAGLAELIWAASVDCPALRDDTLRRQCARLKAGVAPGRIYTIAADASVLERAGATLVVHGSVAGAEPIDVGRPAGPVFVMTSGSVAVADGRPVGPEIARLEGALANGLAATISFTLPSKLVTWSEGGASGVFVDLAGYAVYDRCDGRVLAATAPAEPRKPEPAACVAEAAASEPATPIELSFDQIRSEMLDLEPDIATCYQRYGVPGTAEVYVELASSGVVKYVEVRGDFADTPSGECVTAVVKGAKFPEFRRDSMQIHYSFSLR